MELSSSVFDSTSRSVLCHNYNQRQEDRTLNGNRYLNGVLTVITMLLFLILGTIMHQDNPASTLLNPVYAQPQVSGSNWVFYPVGNQQVRRLVILDKNTNTVYDYDPRGVLENTWVIAAPGERIEKR